MTAFIQRHKISELNESKDIVLSSWIQEEIEKAEESLKRIHSSLEAQQHQEAVRNNKNSLESRNKENSFVYRKTLHSLSERLDFIDVSHSYLCAMKKVNGSVDMQNLLTLESELKLILDDTDIMPSEQFISERKSSTFHELKLQSEIVRIKVVQHIRARSILFLRKVLRKHAFPCPSASEFLVKEMIPNTELYIHTHALEQIDGKKHVARELLQPIKHRITHHFLQSRTIPQNKLDKLPHLLLEYIRKMLLYILPVFEACHVENDALGLVYGLIQHILFRRGYYERLATLNTVELYHYIQCIVQFSKDVQGMVLVTLDSSLFEVLVCRNSQLWYWWIHMESNQANTILRQASQSDDMYSVQERLHSLIFSLEIKVSFVSQVGFRSEYTNNVLVPSCTTYIDILAKRAKFLKDHIDSFTSFNLHPYLSKWMELIDATDSIYSNLNASPCSDLKSFAPSFQKLCDGMIEECTQLYIDILFNGTSFSAFLMNARHLISGDVHDEVSIEDVLALLSVWSNLKGAKKQQISCKVGEIVSAQILSIILDESLSLTVRGCDVFGHVILDIIQELDSDKVEDRGDLRRLQDISLFLQEPSLRKAKMMLYDTLGKVDLNESLIDPAIRGEVEKAIRPDYMSMKVDDALCIMHHVIQSEAI
jgi:hypothetical protein